MGKNDPRKYWTLPLLFFSMVMFALSATVQNEITGGNTEITGNFTIEEADDLANILKSGKLPAPAKIISDTVVGPTLGKEAIHSGFISFILAFALVLVYMIFYYSKSAGTISDIALFANIFLLSEFLLRSVPFLHFRVLQVLC